MTVSDRALEAFGLRDPRPGPLPDSPARFPDGGHYRVEIPSVEGPEAMRTVLAAAGERGVPVHRVSQGSGITLLTDDEIVDMVQQGRDAGVEVSLFTGPRASWGTGVQSTAPSGRVIAGSLRGLDELRAGLLDIVHAADLGVRSVLVSDLGQLAVLGRMRAAGDLPEDFVLKVSISLPVANPATARVLEDLGASTLNLPVDLTVPDIAAIRATVSLPLDVYIEGADDFGGPVRYHDLPEIVRVAAPVYAQLTRQDAPNNHPSGGHLTSVRLPPGAGRGRPARIGLG